ncbi:MAG: GAF domain-containing protein, partial [Desulfomonilaceae bacterium]
MKERHQFPIKTVLSLRPLIDFWHKTMNSSDASWGLSGDELNAKLEEALELMEPITDFSALERHQSVIKTLMSALFPRAFWETQVSGAFIPAPLRPFFVSPLLKTRFLNNDGSLKGRPFPDQETYDRLDALMSYLMVLKKFYEIDSDLDLPLIRVIPDPDTGLDRYYKILIQTKFVEPQCVTPVAQLTEQEKIEIKTNISDLEILSRIIPIENFEFHGFVVAYPFDVTTNVVVSELEGDLIDSCAITSGPGIARLEARLRTLLAVPDLQVGIVGFEGDQAFIFNHKGVTSQNRLFPLSNRVSRSVFSGTQFEAALQTDQVLSVSDASQELMNLNSKAPLFQGDERSLLAAPLKYRGEQIGLLNLTSPHPAEFGILHSGLVREILPIFSVALKRSMEELNSTVDRTIKEKCTAIHPSVEWRFRQAAIEALERSDGQIVEEFTPVIFKNVYALYSSADIQGSTITRNTCIQSDFSEQLQLAAKIVSMAVRKKSFPILDEVNYQIRDKIEKISRGVTTADETPIMNLVRWEIEPLFPFLRSLGHELAESIEEYEKLRDPKTGTIFRERRDFEESVFLLNKTLSLYLEKEQSLAQSIFPHFFDKHQS